MRVRVIIRPLRSEQSLFATRQQGGICLNDSELSRLYVEQVQMISERSAGRGFEALLPPKVPLFGEPCGAIYLLYLYTDNMFYVKINSNFHQKF